MNDELRRLGTRMMITFTLKALAVTGMIGFATALSIGMI
jgi:hypothetical protein